MMTKFPRIGRRIGAAVAASALAALTFTGTALAQDTTLTDAPSTTAPTSTAGTTASPSSSSSSSNPLQAQCEAFAAGGGALTSGFGQYCAFLGFGGFALPTGTTSSSSVPLYPTSEYPVRYYPYSGSGYNTGPYYDYGCGCTQSVPTSTASATQVSSVPKGGVDTGGWDK